MALATLKFKTKNKGIITQGIAQNLNPFYKDKGLKGHTGIDWTTSYDSFVSVDNTGYVYKVFYPQQREDNWVGVYMLVPDGENYMEILMGHFCKVFVKPGDTIKEGQIVGKEGNFGDVYSGGVRITPQMQDAGDTRGHHVHESYRPVKRVKKTKSSEHYLTTESGKKYKDEDGYYYQIIHKNNGLNGCIDPMTYHHIDSQSDKFRCYRNLLAQILFNFKHYEIN